MPVIDQVDEPLLASTKRGRISPNCPLCSCPPLIGARGANQALLNGDSLITATAAIGSSSPSSIAVIISQPSSP